MEAGVSVWGVGSLKKEPREVGPDRAWALDARKEVVSLSGSAVSPETED